MPRRWRSLPGSAAQHNLVPRRERLILISSMSLIRGATLAFLVVLGTFLRIESDTRWLQFHYDHFDSVAIAHHPHDGHVVRANRPRNHDVPPHSPATSFLGELCVPTIPRGATEFARVPLTNRTIVSLLGRLRL